MNINLKQNIDYQCVDDILNIRNFDEAKAAAVKFIATTETLEGMFVWMLCHHLTDALDEWAKRYSAAPRGSKNNAVIIPPVCEVVTVAEINRVLNAAQKAYGILDLLAPKEPQKILCFNNSHSIYNSMCGIPDNSGHAATILVFHPKEVGTYDRVFIFAHELGHALHFALTGNIEVLPDGFDKFNQSIHANIQTLKEQQEAFADAVALAILNVKGLGTHFPTQFSKDMSPCFARYIKAVTAKALTVKASI